MSSDDEQLTDEELQALQEAGYLTGSASSSPGAPKKEDIFTFFKHIIGKEDSSKIGNVSQMELGTPTIPVRALQSVANYASVEGLDTVAAYLNQEAEIILKTSGSLKGFYPQLFVTQIKKEGKIRSGPPPKSGIFSGGKDKDIHQQHGEV